MVSHVRRKRTTLKSETVGAVVRAQARCVEARKWGDVDYVHDVLIMLTLFAPRSCQYDTAPSEPVVDKVVVPRFPREVAISQ